MKLAQAQHVRFTIPLVTDLHLLRQSLLHLLRASPILQIMPPLLVTRINVGQSRKLCASSACRAMVKSAGKMGCSPALTGVGHEAASLGIRTSPVLLWDGTLAET